VQTGQDVFTALAEGQPFAEFGAGKDGARGVHADRPARLEGQRAELVETQIELVGDVTQIATAARGTAVIHLERRHHPLLVELDRLGVLTANVQQRARAREEPVRTAAVAQDLAAHGPLGKGQGLAAVAGSHEGLFLDGLRARVGSRLLDECDITEAGAQDPICGAPQQFREAVRHEPRLDVEDGAIVEGENVLERRLAAFREPLGSGHVRRTCQVAEEVAPPRTPREESRGIALRNVENRFDRRLEPSGPASRCWRGDQAHDLGAQLGELIEVVLEPEGLPEDFGQAVTAPRQAALEQGEARCRQCLLASDCRRDLEVAAAVGDTAAHELAVLVDQDGFGRGGAEVDTDDAPHATFSARRALSICR
jgi:hypothetical protein